MEKYNVSSVEDHWSRIDSHSSDKNFYMFPPIRNRSSKLIFDELDASDLDWCENYTVEKYLKERIPFDKCLSICCGFGPLERTLSRLNVAREIVGTDIAPGAIKAAIETAKKEGFTNISYFVTDLNTADIPENEYDLIWANGALHHIRDLDIVIPKLYKALKKEGFLVSNEYVGPNYQQLSLRHQEIINAIKHLLPDEFRGKRFYASDRSFASKVVSQIDKRWNNRVYSSEENYFGKIWEMPPRSYFLKEDPSECVNSENIIPTLSKFFKDMEVKYFDGSIIQHALDENFYDNFDPKNKDHVALLELLFSIEDHYIATGAVGRHNAQIICRKH